MNEKGKQIVIRFQKRWQLWQVYEVLLYGIGGFCVVFVVSRSYGFAILALLLVSSIVFLLRKPWRISLEKVAAFFDEELSSLENSAGLFLLPGSQLSDLALLQRHRVEERLVSDIAIMKPKVPLKNAFMVFLALIGMAYLLYYFDAFSNSTTFNSPASEDTIIFQPTDSSTVEQVPPRIVQQKLRIKYPAYTRQSSRTSSNMNIKVLEGSNVLWNIQFDQAVEGVSIEQQGEEHPLQSKGDTYERRTTIDRSGFYNFRFEDSNGSPYLSDLYSIEMVKDEVPEIEIRQLEQFSTFDATESKILKFNALISDDYGIADAYIIATVSKGEGESVKFREERLSFGPAAATGSKRLNLVKSIDLDALKMEAGDELYFYVEALDVKEPGANRTRSETFFAVIRDTISNRFAVEGTMGADLMPDYFRSQRQLIIDTEKLIANKNKLSQKEFNFTSNALGYDQKSLRLKYGEFMGDEADSGIQVTEEVEIEPPAGDGSEEEDPLDQFTHDHDSENEHNLVDHDHDDEENEGMEDKDDPLSNYLHDHDNPEESTLFTQSLKSKLRQAMAEMWDAELHLRLYTPENSLPFQYRALKLIQEIKNSARIYVHRIGFDPPPIKEDKRLTGEIDDVKTYQKTEAIAQTDDFEALRKSVSRITELIADKSEVTEADRKLFSDAGSELAALAVASPGKHLNTLQELKWLTERKQTSFEQLSAIQSGIWRALPDLEVYPKQERLFKAQIDEMMLKELEANE